MKISLNWLKQYIDLDQSPQEISEILTAIGLEVEGMETVQSVPGGMDGLVVGEVVVCDKHPNADKLSLTQVNIGSEENLQIVCGAPNVAAGQKVIVATVGAMLYPAEGEPWKIKKGKIRGELSQGMICAEDEIGVGTSHDGIIVLDKTTKVGTSAADVYGVENDIVYDIGLTPNRSDATSHIGVAKDLLAYLKINHNYSGDLNLPEIGEFDSDTQEMNIEVDIQDLNGCPRFTGVGISNVTIGPSPDWMQTRLKSIGVRPISNIVDITNYVLHETGQPLHAYDADQIKGQKVIVRCLPEGTKFTTLDEVERTLRAGDVMVCDGQNNPMCIGGVFGGASSGVTDSTNKIFLEAAHFNAKSIRVTSMKHLLRTDAAMRFEKGSDPRMPIFALKRAASLIKELANAQIASKIVDVYPDPIQAQEIFVRYQKVNDLIGNELSQEKIKNILLALQIKILSENDEGLQVSIPTDKSDVLREVDVIEEILRIYGFNAVQIDHSIRSSITYSDRPNKFELFKDLRNFLAGKGLHEMMNMSITQSAYYEQHMPDYMDSLVYINNTSNVGLDIMRPEMMMPVLQTILHNQNRQQKHMALFEFGRKYQKSEDTNEEEELLTIALCNTDHDASWLQAQSADQFYEIKRIVEEILDFWGIVHIKQSDLEDKRFDFGISYDQGPKSVIKYGRVKQSMSQAIGIKGAVNYAEISLKPMIRKIKKQKFKVEEINKFPSSRRDLALVIDENIRFDQITKIARQYGGKLMKQINLFDVYKSVKHLGVGKKSYSVSFVFEDLTKTLKDKDVDKVMDKLISMFEKEISALIRR